MNRFVVPVPADGALVDRARAVPELGARRRSLEEVIVVGFLITRLRQLDWTPIAAIAASSLLRASYHLYQGWGGFLGNLAMGVLFATLFLRWRRTWPFVIAHFLLDVGAGIGFLLFRDRLPGF